MSTCSVQLKNASIAATPSHPASCLNVKDGNEYVLIVVPLSRVFSACSTSSLRLLPQRPLPEIGLAGIRSGLGAKHYCSLHSTLSRRRPGLRGGQRMESQTSPLSRPPSQSAQLPIRLGWWTSRICRAPFFCARSTRYCPHSQREWSKRLSPNVLRNGTSATPRARSKPSSTAITYAQPSCGLLFINIPRPLSWLFRIAPVTIDCLHRR